MYWYGGNGNWSDYTNHWSNNSGNTPSSPAANAPTSTDDAIFDSLSNATAYTVTVDATANCANFTMGAPLAGAVTWAGSSALNIYGNLNLSGGTAGITRTYTGAITFASTTTSKTITSNSVQLQSNIYFNGAGGGWTLSDALYTEPNTKSIYFDGGAFNSGGVSSDRGSETPNNAHSSSQQKHWRIRLGYACHIR